MYGWWGYISTNAIIVHTRKSSIKKFWFLLRLCYCCANYLKLFALKCIVVIFGLVSRNDTLNKLRVAYNNCLRRLMSIPKFCSASQMFVYLDVRSFGEIRRKMVFIFIDRLKKSDNGLIKSVNTMCFNCNLQQYWRGILYTNQ